MPIQQHEAFSFCYYIVWRCEKDARLTVTSKPKMYRGPNASKIFRDWLVEDVQKIEKIYQKNMPLLWTAEDFKEYVASSLCHICAESLHDDKVADHNRLTGKFRDAAHSKCNLEYQLPHFVPVFIHNLSGYDAHLFIRDLAYDSQDIEVIPSSEERYISFSKHI